MMMPEKNNKIKSTGAVITAAGMSSRMGEFKPLLPYKGTTMIRYLAELFLKAGADPVVVVTGFRGTELQEHLGDLNVMFVENSEYAATEMFDSIKMGLKALLGKCEQAVFAPVDVPDLSLELIKRVMSAEGQIVRPVHHGRPGHPVAVDAALIPLLCEYNGDRGFRGALESVEGGIQELETESEGIYNDIDTMEDYRRLVGAELQKAADDSSLRTLYLVRHGQTDFYGGEKRCIGRTDLPLSEKGRRQALKLRAYFDNVELEAVYTSPLCRAVETARLAVGEDHELRIMEGLTEMDMGIWENQPLSSIAKKLEDEPPGGELRKDGLMRFSGTIDKIIAETSGNVLVVAHAGVICAYLAERMNEPLDTSRAIRQPYCGLNILSVRSGCRPKVLEYGIRAECVPDEEEIQELFARSKTPEKVILHGRAVAKMAMEIAEALNKKGMKLDSRLVYAGALLHDIERLHKGHAKRGSELLKKEGYLKVADLIRQHDELDEMCLNEAAIVFYADKRYRETEMVSLEERFADSAGKRALSPEAQEAFQRRFRQAREIEAKVRECCFGKKAPKQRQK